MRLRSMRLRSMRLRSTGGSWTWLLQQPLRLRRLLLQRPLLLLQPALVPLARLRLLRPLLLCSSSRSLSAAKNAWSSSSSLTSAMAGHRAPAAGKGQGAAGDPSVRARANY